MVGFLIVIAVSATASISYVNRLIYTNVAPAIGQYIIDYYSDRVASTILSNVPLSTHHTRRSTNLFDGATDAFIASLDAWWSSEMPQTFSLQYTPLESGVWPLTASASIPACGETVPHVDKVLAYNAFYCSGVDYIAYDDVALFPLFDETFGAASLGIILAHEWGHAIQYRTHTVDVPEVISELQADCYAGAWAASIDSTSPAGRYISEQSIRQALGAVVLLGDAEGVTSTDPGAHGSGFDRLAAFEEGYRLSTAHCAGYVDTPPPTFQLPWTSAVDYANGGDLPWYELLPAISASVEEYVASNWPAASAYPVVSISDVPVGSCITPNFAEWCGAIESIVVDEYATQDMIEVWGDMAVGYAIAVQALRAVPSPCAASQWVAWMYAATVNRTSSFTLSPGDLDEVVLYILYRDRLGDGYPRTSLSDAFAAVSGLEKVLTTGQC